MEKSSLGSRYLQNRREGSGFHWIRCGLFVDLNSCHILWRVRDSAHSDIAIQSSWHSKHHPFICGIRDSILWRIFRFLPRREIPGSWNRAQDLIWDNGDYWLWCSFLLRWSITAILKSLVLLLMNELPTGGCLFAFQNILFVVFTGPQVRSEGQQECGVLLLLNLNALSYDIWRTIRNDGPLNATMTISYIG